MSTPYTIKTIMEQLGTGLNGALAYIGAHSLYYTHPAGCRDRECRPSEDSMVNADVGTVKADVALWCKVNTRRDVRICVAYETDDTYTVYLWRANGPAKRLETGKMGEVLEESHDVYCDMLPEVVERFYDEYIRQHQAGAILI